MKPFVFKGIELDDAFKFLIDYHENYYEYLHKIGIRERYNMKFLTFKLYTGAKQ